ncbi:MAG: prepilin peptidase [Planctomycetota bacterium]|nr:prepilin peptidase [Planctomycetota bacterium]
MAQYQWMLLTLDLIWTLFIFAFGACVGSLVNVLVYRLPLGISVVTPPSRCPSCNTQLTFRENIPILGWLLLRGKCRYCQTKISPEYPIVEAITAVLFAGVFILFYVLPGNAYGSWHAGGLVNTGPEWAASGLGLTWPTLVVLLILVGSLVAMTIVDAKTFTIPLVLTWTPAIVGVVGHVGHAVWIEVSRGRLPDVAPGWNWTIATPVGASAWWGIGGAIGGMVGLLVSNLLLSFGWIRRSFADYDVWEAELRKTQEAAGETAEAGGAAMNTPDVWVQYPHARREMMKEVVFVAPVVALGFLGGALASRWGGVATFNPVTGLLALSNEPPLWLSVLGGVLLGYLVGGGVVWGTRIAGSLGFGKEAMGLGDVHLMAAVGACLGWIDAVLAFFLAAFVGVAWAVLGVVAGGKVKRSMPYGPFLAVATLLVLFCKPLIERGLTRLLHAEVPINLP